MNTSEIDLDSPAIRALGSLFKLTEVFLRDDGFPIDDNRQVSSCPKHIRFKYDDDDEDEDVNDECGGKNSSNSSIETAEESVVMEDADLSQEMSALGLPLSFQTSKQHSSVQTKGKHKATQQKNQKLLSSKLSEESRSYAEFQDKSNDSSSLSLPEQAKLSCSVFDVSNDTAKLSNSCDGEQPANMAGETGYGGLEKKTHENLPKNMSSKALIDDLLGTDQMENKISKVATSNLFKRNIFGGCYMLDDGGEEHPNDIHSNLMERVDTKGLELGEAMQLDDLDSSMFVQQPQVSGTPIDSHMDLDHGINDDVSFSAVCGEWSAFWDSFYMRYYFYNTKTEESTWYPPPGMESFAYGDVSNVFAEPSSEVIGTNVDPTSQNEQQIDGNELVDKTCFEEKAGDKVWGVRDLPSKNLSGSALLSDVSCVVNLYDHRQKEFTLTSPLSTISHNQSPENEIDQEGSGDMCAGGLLSNDFDSVDSPCEYANGNCNGYVTAQFSNASSLSSIDEAAVCDDDLINHVHMEELGKEAKGFRMQDEPAATKQKKKRRNRRRRKPFNNNDDDEFQPVEEYCVDITKYWCQRYLLFSKFDDGIQMDEEGWFSVTPEAIARHHALRSGGGIVIDCFTGVGGNAIQFAKASKHVIAIDIDPKKIDYAHHNAAIYGVEDRIDFISGDSFSVAPMLKADTVFLSPPWGGPDYLKVKSYDITMLQPYDGQFLFNTFMAAASLIIMFLPRNVDIIQLAELSRSSNTPWSLEVEKNFLNGKLKAVTAYFSKIS